MKCGEGNKVVEYYFHWELHQQKSEVITIISVEIKL